MCDMTGMDFSGQRYVRFGLPSKSFDRESLSAMRKTSNYFTLFVRMANKSYPVVRANGAFYVPLQQQTSSDHETNHPCL